MLWYFLDSLHVYKVQASFPKRMLALTQNQPRLIENLLLQESCKALHTMQQQVRDELVWARHVEFAQPWLPIDQDDTHNLHFRREWALYEVPVYERERVIPKSVRYWHVIEESTVGTGPEDDSLTVPVSITDLALRLMREWKTGQMGWGSTHRNTLYVSYVEG